MNILMLQRSRPLLSKGFKEILITPLMILMTAIESRAALRKKGTLPREMQVSD